MKKIIIFAAAVCILTMGLFNYLKSPGNNRRFSNKSCHAKNIKVPK